MSAARCNICALFVSGDVALRWCDVEPPTIGELKREIDRSCGIPLVVQVLCSSGDDPICDDTHERLALGDHTLTICTRTFAMNNKSLRQAIRLYLMNPKLFRNKFGGLEYLDVSNVTDMSELFCCLHIQSNNFGPLNVHGWNTSNVTNMARMFFCHVPWQ